MEYKNFEVRAAEGLHEQCIALFERHVDRGANVIDMAAGAGAFSVRLHECGYSVTANDIDPKAWGPIDIPKLSLDLNRPMENDLSDETYDAVVAMEVIEHLENPSKLLRDCLRIVKPGGIVLLSTPNVLDIDSRLIFLRSGLTFHINPQSYEATGHRTILPRWLLEILIDDSGLQIREMQWGGTVPGPGNANGIRRAIWNSVKWISSKFVRDTTQVELNSNYLIYVLQKAAG